MVDGDLFGPWLRLTTDKTDAPKSWSWVADANLGFVPQHPHTLSILRKASQLKLHLALGSGWHSLAARPFGFVSWSRSCSAGRTCPSLQLRFLTRRSPSSAITRSP